LLRGTLRVHRLILHCPHGVLSRNSVAFAPDKVKETLRPRLIRQVLENSLSGLFLQRVSLQDCGKCIVGHYVKLFLATPGGQVRQINTASSSHYTVHIYTHHSAILTLLLLWIWNPSPDMTQDHTDMHAVYFDRI
jgi:hypothetical protein